MVPPKPMGIYAAYASKYNFIVPPQVMGIYAAYGSWYNTETLLDNTFYWFIICRDISIACNLVIVCSRKWLIKKL